MVEKVATRAGAQRFPFMEPTLSQLQLSVFLYVAFYNAVLTQMFGDKTTISVAA
jgi:hypothetical protein